MKGKINLKNTPHNFEKVNLVSLKDGADLYRCTKCNLKGKREGLSEYVRVTQGKREIFFNCIEKSDFKSIQINLLEDIPVSSTNLKKGTHHHTIDVPKGYEHLRGEGVWVSGNVEPVRILPHEYEVIK